MKTNKITKAIAIMITTLLLILPFTSVSAFDSLQETDNKAEFEPGAVIVSLKFDSPSVTSLLSGFDIVEARLITPGSSTQNVYLVRFKEKTKEIVWRAIEDLKKSPYVVTAEPDYYQYIDDEIEDIITDNPPSNPKTSTQPTTSAINTTKATDNDAEFEPGAVIVSLKSNSPSVTSLLNGFEIEEERLITPGSDTQNVYLVRFKEKTKEIVWRAIDVLKKSPYVITAEPDYYQSVDDEVGEIITDKPSSNLTTSTQPTTSAADTTQATDNNAEFELGSVIVSLKSNSPSVTSLLSGFDIEEARLITPGSDTQNVYLVRFKEKTKEIVWRAIDVLKKSPYVLSAEPDYYQYVDDEIEDIITDNPPSNPTISTQPTTSAINTTKATDNDAEFELGSVIVSLKSNSPSVTSLLNGFSIEEERLITPGSTTQNVYLVRFAEKTKEIVWRAIDVLKNSPYVITAEPDYYQSVDDEVEEIITENPSSNPTTPTQPITSAVVPTQATDNNAEFEPGAVIVSLKSNSPSVTSLLSGFDIEEARLITPGSDTQNVYLVRFTEKTKEIVWRAIDVLKNSPYVITAEPDYYQYIDDEIEETTSDNNSTEPTEPTTDKLTEPVTTEPTESSANKPTEPVTSEPTEATTDNPTEPVTTDPTEATTDKPTEPVTTNPTESSTDKPTEPVTNEPTVTEPPTDKQTEPATTDPIAINPQPTENKPTTPTVVKPTVKKKANPINVTVKTKTIKAKKLKKKTQEVKVITVKNNQGKVTYKLVKSGITKKIRKFISINKKGTIIINKWKKAKVGTYKIKVRITAKGNSKYKPKTLIKTVKIKIK